MTHKMPLPLRILLIFIPKNDEQRQKLSRLYFWLVLGIGSGIPLFIMTEEISRLGGLLILCISHICWLILHFLNGLELKKDWDKKVFESTPPGCSNGDIFSQQNKFTGDLPWEQFSEQLMEKHKKEGRSASWTRVCLKLAEETNQGFVSIFFDELISFESPSDELLIFYVPSQFIGDQIQRVPHEKILKAVNTEFPKIKELRVEVKGGKR